MMLLRNPPNHGETSGTVLNASLAPQVQGRDYAEVVQILLQPGSPANVQPIGSIEPHPDMAVTPVQTPTCDNLGVF